MPVFNISFSFYNSCVKLRTKLSNYRRRTIICRKDTKSLKTDGRTSPRRGASVRWVKLPPAESTFGLATFIGLFLGNEIKRSNFLARMKEMNQGMLADQPCQCVIFQVSICIGLIINIKRSSQAKSIN